MSPQFLKQLVMDEIRTHQPYGSVPEGVEGPSDKARPDIPESDAPIHPSLSTPRKFGLVIVLASSGFLNVSVCWMIDSIE